MTPKYQDTCTVSYWKQQSLTRDVGVRDTDFQLPSACDPACLCTNAHETRATKALVTATFRNKRAYGKAGNPEPEPEPEPEHSFQLDWVWDNALIIQNTFALLLGRDNTGELVEMWVCVINFWLHNLCKTKTLRGEKLNYKSVAKEIWKPPFFGSWSPVGTESLPCLFDSRFL